MSDRALMRLLYICLGLMVLGYGMSCVARVVLLFMD